MTLEELKKLHDKTCAICREVMVKKNSDYTGGTKAKNIFANFESARYLGIHPVQGIMMRIMDKIQRINSFTNDKELQVPNESVYDACEDIVNYEPLIALDGGIDGLDLIKKVIYKSNHLLKRKGLLALEIGNKQYQKVSSILKYCGYREVSKEYDYNRNVRCIFSTKT